jgi:hypothetical protein
MQFQGAVVKEQGVTFAVVVVQRHVVEDPNHAEQAISSFSGAFPGIPIVVMGQDPWGRARYYGRRDIVNFLANVPIQHIPWRQYNWN